MTATHIQFISIVFITEVRNLYSAFIGFLTVFKGAWNKMKNYGDLLFIATSKCFW